MDTTARTISCFIGVSVALALTGSSRAVHVEQDLDGDASSGLVNHSPNSAVQAAFAERSYVAGSTAVLHLRGTAASLTVRFYEAGAGHDGPLQGSPVGPPRHLRTSAHAISFRLGDWPSGFYYAQVTTPGRGEWYAPLIVRPHRLGAHRVLVVLPTNTWQAYNFEDRDSWYADSSVHSIELSRPFVEGGVPPHYHGYDRGFLRWLSIRGYEPDFLADDDLDRIANGGELARAYDLIVFPGHEEYVTEREFDVIQRYRDLGGNLAFLSANDFFYKVVKRGDRMDGRWRWRDLGRPEAALVGAQYVDWNHAQYANRPFTVTGTGKAPWLFRDTGLHDGDSFGNYGIEIDARDGASPPDTRVLARIRDIFGAGKSAEMTYYTTRHGAKVFSAGVMNFGGSALWPVVSTMMQNLWRELSRP